MLQLLFEFFLEFFPCLINILDYCGDYLLNFTNKEGKTLLKTPLLVNIPMGELEKQAMPSDEIELMSSTGSLSYSLSLITLNINSKISIIY